MRRRDRRRDAHRRSIIDQLETTPATVARHNASRAADDAFGEELDFDWRPQPLERVVEGDRSFRWPIIGAALVLAAIAILLVRGLGTFSEAQADERLATYRVAVTDFESALNDLEASLPGVGLEDALAFSAATDALRETANEPLPGLPPFVPQGALGDVSLARDHLLTTADIASSVSSDLDASATFTEAAESLFAVPPLPFSAPEELITPAGEAIIDMQAETRATLASLDPDPTFATYLAQVEAALEDVPDWTDRYLLALRRGDAETAETLINAIRQTEETLNGELNVGLTAIAKGVEERLDELRRAIERARVLTAS